MTRPPEPSPKGIPPPRPPSSSEPSPTQPGSSPARSPRPDMPRARDAAGRGSSPARTPGGSPATPGGGAAPRSSDLAGGRRGSLEPTKPQGPGSGSGSGPGGGPDKAKPKKPNIAKQVGRDLRSGSNSAAHVAGQSKRAGGRGMGRAAAKEGLAAGITGVTGGSIPLPAARVIVTVVIGLVTFFFFVTTAVVTTVIVSSDFGSSGRTGLAGIGANAATSVPPDYLKAYSAAAQKNQVPAALLVAIGERTQHGRYSPYDDLDRDPEREEQPFQAGGQPGPSASATKCTGTLAMPTPPAGDVRMNRAEFGAGLLQALGVPVSCENLAVMVAWQVFESAGMNNGAYHNNPMNTSQRQPGDSVARGRFPDYPTPEVGIQAEVATLTNPTPAWGYAKIIDGFRLSDIAATADAVHSSAFCAGGCYGERGAKLVAAANGYLSDPAKWQREGSVVVGTAALGSVPVAATPGYNGTAAPVSAPLSPSGQNYQPAPNGSSWPDTSPDIGGESSSQGVGPMLIDPAAADEDGIDPQNAKAVIKYVASELGDARDLLVSQGQPVPEATGDATAAAAFWSEAVTQLPLVDPAVDACAVPVGGVPIDRMIQNAFRCETGKTPVEVISGGTGGGSSVSFAVIDGDAATRQLVSEALAVANATSSMGTAPCVATDQYAGVFPLTLAQAQAANIDRCSPSENIATTARLVVAGEATKPSSRRRAAGPYQPMLAGWGQIGDAVPGLVQNQLSVSGPYKLWVASSQCQSALDVYLTRVADEARPLFAGYAAAGTTPDGATGYTTTNRAALEAAFRSVSDPRGGGCEGAPAGTGPWAGSPDWVAALTSAAERVASRTYIEDNTEAAERLGLVNPQKREAWRGVGAAIGELTAGTVTQRTAVRGTDSLVDRLRVTNSSNLAAEASLGHSATLSQQIVSRASVLGTLVYGEDAPDDSAGVPVPQFTGGFDATGCPTAYPATHVRGQIPDLATLCARAVAGARTPQAAAALKFALAQVGRPYCRPDRPSACAGDGNRFGEGPAKGFDCSGLMFMSYKAAGVDFGGATVTWTQIDMPRAMAVPLTETRPGDLLLSYGGGHIGMALTDGLQVAASDFGTGVIITKQRGTDRAAWVNPA